METFKRPAQLTCRPKPGMSWSDGYSCGWEDETWGLNNLEECQNCGKTWGSHSGLICYDNNGNTLESWYHPKGKPMSKHAVPWTPPANELGEVSL